MITASSTRSSRFASRSSSQRRIPSATGVGPTQSPGEGCKVSPAGNLVAGGIRVHERPLVCREASSIRPWPARARPSSRSAWASPSSSPSSWNVSIASSASRSISTAFQSGLDLHVAAPSWTCRRAASPRSPRLGGGFDALLQERLRLRPAPRLEQRVAELALDTRALARVGDPERERALEQVGRRGQVAALVGAQAGRGEVAAPRARRARGSRRRAGPSSVR